MDWKNEIIRKAFEKIGYRVGWTDLMHLDSEGNENYNVILVPLRVEDEDGLG